MNDKLFDDFIKEKIGNHVATVPVDMWNKIVQEKGRDKKSIYWWQPVAAVVVVGCMAIFFGWFDPFGTSEAEFKQGSTLQYNAIDLNSHGVTFNSQLSNSANQNSKTPENLAPQNISKLSNQVTNGKAVPTTFKDNNIARQNIKSSSIKSNLKATNQRLNANSSKNNLGSTSRPKTWMKNNISNEEVQSESPIAQVAIRPYYDRFSLVSIKEKIAAQNAASNISLSNKKSNFFSSVDCPSDRRSGNHGLYFELFGSPDIAFKQMEYKKVGNGINSKDSTSNKQLSYSLGFRLTKEIGQNLLVKTGLQYAQINERFDYRNENERTVSTVITIRTITNSNGTTTTIRDTSLVEQIGYRVKTTYNRYRSWDVPVILGYELNGEGWKANINGGAIFNLSSTQQGEFLDTSYRPASFSKSGPAIFKKKVGVGLYAGLSFIKEISNCTSFFAEPYIRYSLSDRTTNASPFTQRFHTAGILLGIRFKLNGSGAAK